jgi:cold shock protein
MESERYLGTIKWFRAEGYGRIARDNGEDVFVHQSSIQARGYQILEEGRRVQFGIEQGATGPKAVNVSLQ